MKVAYLFLLLLVIGACTPEKATNRKIDGKWSLNSVDGIALDAAVYSKTVEFSKKHKGGTVIYTTTINGVTEVKTGTYALLKCYTITVAFENSNQGFHYDTEVFDYTKEKNKAVLTLKSQTDGKVYIFKKVD